jgi:hypothetical protein
MQPIAKPQDFTRTPLNDLLGTKANVRLLRLLANEVSGPIGVPEAAEQVGLTEAGARRSLRRLAKTGFVELIGGGRAQKFRIRDSDQLSLQLRELFRAEASRHVRFQEDLRAVFHGLPEIQLAWVESSPSAPGEPLHIGILASARALTYLEESVRERISELEGGFDLAIEIHLYSRAEIDVDGLDPETVLVGHHLLEDVSPGSSGTHEERLERSRRVSRVIAGMLDRDPSLRRRAERHLEFLLSRDQGTAAPDIREWRNILAHYSPQRLKDFLVSDTARAERLRQSSPFFAVLTHDEREELLSSLEKRNSDAPAT